MNKLKRNKLGRFIKGFHYSKKTEFKRGDNKGLKTQIKKGQHLSRATEFKKVFTKKELKKRRNLNSKNWRENNMEKWKAQVLARKIKIPKGTLCCICKKELAKIKHHEDYSKPLKIKFVCYRCHNKKRKVKNNGSFATKFHRGDYNQNKD